MNRKAPAKHLLLVVVLCNRNRQFPCATTYLLWTTFIFQRVLVVSTWTKTSQQPASNGEACTLDAGALLTCSLLVSRSKGLGPGPGSSPNLSYMNARSICTSKSSHQLLNSIRTSPVAYTFPERTSFDEGICETRS